MATCKVFAFKIADNEKDGEDPANQVLVDQSLLAGSSPSFSRTWNKCFGSIKSMSTRQRMQMGLQSGWMPWEGSSDSRASTLSQMDEYIIREHVRRCPELSRGECAPLTICGCRGCLWPARHDTTVAEKFALVSRATRATCIFGISGVLIDMFLFAQFD